MFLKQVSFLMTRGYRNAILGAITIAGFCVFGPSTPSFLTLQTPSRPSSSLDHLAATAPCQRTLIFVGDVMLARGVGRKMEAKGDWSYPFRQVPGVLHGADLAYCNLECPISDRGRNLHHLYSFRADPRALEGIKEAGFTIVSEANNHAYDWGPAALVDTVGRLHAVGIRTVGAGKDALEAHHPTVVDLGGLRVAFLAYVNIDPQDAAAGVNHPGVAWLNVEQVVADIRFARNLADLLVVCPHWGVEYATAPTRQQEELARRMIDAGADLIVGSHPHVVQPLEQYRGRWIAYSLGNFVFDQKDRATHRGLMLKVTVREKKIAEVAKVPIEINADCQALRATPKEQVSELLRATRLPHP
jgi:poly-gamma-glutamate synthesis protein (capsule biosynthesis protein)